MAPVAAALVRSTEIVPSTTQKPCCTLVTSAMATATATASAARALFRNQTDRKEACPLTSRRALSSATTRGPDEVAVSRPPRQRESSAETMAGVAWRVATRASVALLIAATATSRAWNEIRAASSAPSSAGAPPSRTALPAESTELSSSSMSSTRPGTSLPTEQAGALTQDSGGLGEQVPFALGHDGEVGPFPERIGEHSCAPFERNDEVGQRLVLHGEPGRTVRGGIKGVHQGLLGGHSRLVVLTCALPFQCGGDLAGKGRRQLGCRGPQPITRGPGREQ